MDLQLNGKTALVTGSSVGIGAGIVQTLAREGVSVIVHGRNAERTEAVAEADELTQSSDWDAGEFCTLAGVYARASGKVAGKKEEYAARAVGLLRAAVKAGFRNAEMLANDEDMALLRGRDDFNKLLEEVEAKRK